MVPQLYAAFGFICIYVHMYIFERCRNAALRARPADVGAAAVVIP